MPLRLSADPERAARRREWLSRALFEAGLILFGILGSPSTSGRTLGSVANVLPP